MTVRFQCISPHAGCLRHVSILHTHRRANGFATQARWPNGSRFPSYILTSMQGDEFLTYSVYRVRQKIKNSGETLGADQFAALIHSIRQRWGERDAAVPRPVPQEPFSWDEHQKRNRNGLVLFSGDLFNPSVESSITRGAHMVPVINSMLVDCSCLGKWVLSELSNNDAVTTGTLDILIYSVS